MDIVEIGKRIKTSRIEQGMLQKELAEKVKVAPSTIQRYEAGQIKDIKMPVIESIARALNVNPAWVICKSENKTIIYKKTSAPDGGVDLDRELISMLTQLSPEDAQRVRDFVAGLKASHKE